MADKFPPIENLDINDESAEGDFLAREKAALGDEFTTEDDQKILQSGDEDDELTEFQSNFPDISKSSEGVAGEQQDEEQEHEQGYSDNNNEGYGYSNDNGSDTNIFGQEQGESEPVKQWREKREAEIEEKDKISAARHEEIVQEARGLIDQFYEDYNSKKDIKIQQVKDEEAAFISKRDDFFKNDSSIWDRTIKLIELKKSSGSVADGRDKTRFKELLLSLKGKTDVPGAAGY